MSRPLRSALLRGASGKLGCTAGAVATGPPWAGCLQSEPDTHTGAPGLWGNGSVEHPQPPHRIGWERAVEGAVCPQQRLAGETAVRPPSPEKDGHVGPACHLSPQNEGLTCRRGSGDPPKEGWTPELVRPPPAPHSCRRRTPGPPTPGGLTAGTSPQERRSLSSPFLLYR